MNILITLPVGILVIAMAFILLKKLFSLSTLVCGGVMALTVIIIVSFFSILYWPGADVFAIHLSLYLMTVYALSIVFKVREANPDATTGRFHWGPATIIGFFAALAVMIVVIQTVQIAWPLYTVVGSITAIVVGILSGIITRRSNAKT